MRFTRRAVLAVMVGAFGCGGPASPEPSTPVVEADSEAAKQALAEAKEQIQANKAAEAKLFRKARGVAAPEG